MESSFVGNEGSREDSNQYGTKSVTVPGTTKVKIIVFTRTILYLTKLHYSYDAY